MKVIVAGSRTIHDFPLVSDAIEAFPYPIDEIVSGGANGVDSLAEKYARLYHYPLKVFPAKWHSLGKSVGFHRNEEMARYVGSEGGLIAIWDSISRGTSMMIEIARKHGIYTMIRMVG